ncbi:MAG: hypothetical protein ACI84C_002676 [Flavobacteriales bacterium]
MKLTDDQIQKLFGEKLADAQAPVDPAIWSSVQSSIGGAASASGSGLFGSLGWVASAAAVVAISVVAYVALKDDQPLPEPVQVTTPIEQVTPIQADQEENKIVIEQVEVEQITADKGVRVIPEETSSAETSIEQTKLNSSAPNQETLRDQSTDTVVSYEIARGASPIVVAEKDVSPTIEASKPAASPVEISAKFSAIRDWQDELTYQLIADHKEEALFEWSINGDLHAGNPLTYSFEEGEHLVQLTVTRANGNNQTHETPLLVYKKPTVANVNTFTPFGSPGISDLFDLQAVAVNITITRVIIRDTMNEVVYDSEHRSGPWDGRDRFGERCEVITYTYLYEGIDVYGDPVSGGGRVRINNN